jgi:hypothetical protein
MIGNLQGGKGVPLEYLASATNTLAQTLSHQELDVHDFRVATGVACKALNSLYADSDLDDAFTSPETLGQQHRATVTNIVEGVEHFTAHFLRAEMDMLETACHVDRSFVNALRGAALDLRKATLAETPSLLILKQRISTLRDEACGVSAEIKRLVNRRKRLGSYPTFPI